MLVKVMYIDDEPDLCTLFSALYTSEKFLIKTFIEPKLALEAIPLFQPDVIFIDYRFPSTNGEELAKLMPREIPKYLITGEYAIESSPYFKRVFVKPLDIEAIQKELYNILQKKSLKPIDIKTIGYFKSDEIPQWEDDGGGNYKAQ